MLLTYTTNKQSPQWSVCPTLHLIVGLLACPAQHRVNMTNPELLLAAFLGEGNWLTACPDAFVSHGPKPNIERGDEGTTRTQ